MMTCQTCEKLRGLLSFDLSFGLPGDWAHDAFKMPATEHTPMTILKTLQDPDYTCKVHMAIDTARNTDDVTCYVVEGWVKSAIGCPCARCTAALTPPHADA